MKTSVLSSRYGPSASGDSVKPLLTSTNQKGKWGKQSWDRLEKVLVRCFWVVSVIMICMMTLGVFRVWAFGLDADFRPRWYDEPAIWTLNLIMDESPTIDPDSPIREFKAN